MDGILTHGINSPKKVVSLGYRCSAAGIIKRLGRKTESYPFDWLISRLPIVQDCIETDFRNFLDQQKYVMQQTTTVHYDTYTNDEIKICDETIYYNTHYAEFPLHAMHTPAVLKQTRDTYAYPLATNHHNMTNPNDREYYARCIGRFQKLMEDESQPVLFFYIHPALTLREFNAYKSNLVQSFTSFAKCLYKKVDDGISRILFIIPVQTSCPYPITNRYPNVLETLFETPAIIIRAMYVNKDFVDAGEIFMRNAYIETDTLCSYVATLIQLGFA